MKKVELVTINKQIANQFCDGELYTVTYLVDGRQYFKHNVRISMYGYTFDEQTGVDDFNISMYVVEDKK